MNDTMKYYQVKVEVDREVSTDKTKKVNEIYIVQAISCSDVETIVYEYFKDTTPDFKVTAITETKIIDVLDKDSQLD